MSMPWVILGSVVVLAAVALVVQRGRMRELSDRMDRERAEARSRIASTVTESQAKLSRIERETDRRLARAEHDLLGDLLPVLDALEAASNLDETADPAAIRQGLKMVNRQLDSLLETHEIERIRPQAGMHFDPEFHEAVEVRQTDEVAAGAIATCHRAGYRQGEQLLRAAMVAVAGPSEPESDESVEEPDHRGASVDRDPVGSEVSQDGPAADSPVQTVESTAASGAES